MPLDSKLQRRRLANDTYKDDMSADKTESPLNTLVPVLAASAGLYAMYKKGMLQPLVKSGMEVFETVAKKNTDKAYMNLKSIKEWTKFENLSPDKLKEIGYRIPKDSIFRGKGINKLKSLGLDTMSEIEKGDIRLGYARKVINDTIEDVNQLKRLIEENTKRVDAYKQKYYDSDLITGMKELRKFSREVNANNSNARLFVNEKAAQEFISMHTLSQEEEKRLLKINGYRPVMLQDIMDTPEKVQLDEGSKYIYKAKEGSKINLQDNTGTQKYNSADELLNIMSSSDFRYINKSGKSTNMIGDWENTKRLILDKNILIDESGNLIDLRMSDEMLKDIKESITKEFQIPGLGFNPLASLLPSWTKARIRKPNFGILSKDSIQPFITGEAGQKFLGKDLFVLNGKAFKVTENGLEQVADNIVLNDISRANQYGLNKKMETIRKMANLKYYDFKLKDNIQQEIDSGSLKGKFYSYLDKANKWLDSGKPDNYIHKTRFNPDGERIDIDNEWAFNPDIDSFLTNKIHKLTSKFNMYEPIDIKTPENIFGNGPKDIVNEITNSTESSRKFIATRRGMSIHDLKEQEGIENKISFTKDYLGQIFAGRNKDNTISDLTTETSLRAYGLFDNVFGRLNAIAPQLGFSTESKGSLPEYIKNMALKRVLPIYAVTQVPEMLNALSEPIFNLFDDDEDGTGNKNNITKFTMSNIVKPLDLGMHKVKDILGITKLNKKIEEFTPGFDQINELPGIYHLGLNQTYKERKDYIENGYDPIRKARYWGMGNCVIPEQDIQCGYGVTKKAKDIQINDLVITHEGILKPVLHVFTRQMKNNEWTPEIELYTTIFNNVTTDNHPYLAVAVKEKQCPSSSFKDYHPNRNSNTCKKCVYKACKEKNIWNPEWTLARDLKVGDYLAYPRIKILDIQKDINSLPANNEIGYLLGIFLAEGNIHTWHKNGKTYGIELTLNNAEINIANKVKDILNKYFPNTNTSINFTKNSGNGVITIRNLSTKVSEWFRSVLYQDREKHFIPNIYYYNKDFILSVITGLFDGDGHFSYKSNSLQLAYTSHRVEYVIQIRNLLYTLGYANSIIHCDKKLNGKKYTGYRLFITGDNAVKLNKELDLYKTKSYTFNLSNINDKYTIIDDNYIYLKIKSIDDNGYRGIVYDYEIKDSHSFCSLSTIMHNTPFTGGKIMYWRPNLYRRIEADVDFSDSKWGSRQEYYSNTWYPNPVNPLAPINHFILDKNHYDKKHYQDRPYLLTSKEGNNIPIIGPLYSATVGNIINPQKRMHEEYWKDNKPIEKNDENVAIVDYVNQATLYQKQMASNNAFINSNTITNINNSYKQSQSKDGYARAVSSKQAQEVVQYNSSPQNIISGNILPTQTDNTFSSFVGNLSNLEIYTTPSGSTSLVDIPDTLTTWDANQRLREYSIKRFSEADTRVDLKDNKFNPQLADYTNEKINNAFIYNVGEEFNTLADFFGMKGFETQAFITGKANVGAKIIEDSNYAYSFNKDFWDENLGGFGGDASEIFRRFVQKRNTGTEYINPIRNTMPSYMPGCFIAGTKVFIENKVNNIEDLQIGQKVYDHNGKLQTIEYVHQGQYDGDMISIKAKGICNTITATGNHPFYVMTSNYCTYAHSHKRMCIPGIHPNNNKPCNYCKNKQWNFFEWKKARELKEGDYLAIAIPKNNHSINELIIPNSSRKMVKDISGKHIPLDFNFGIFTGFYLSEGHADKYRITFGSGKCEPEQIESVKYIGNLLGLTTSSFDVYDENGIGCIVTDIHSKQLSDLMKENFGHLSYNKSLPDWIFDAPIEYQMGVIAGMIQSDGSVGKKLELLLSSVSYSLLQNTLLILAQNNMCSTIKSKVNNYEHIQYTLSISQKDAVTLKKLTHSYGTKILQIPDEYPKCTGCSSVIYNGYLLRKIDKIEKYNDTVTVYNLQVANSHTYNVEGVSVHNSNYFTDFLHGDPYGKVDNGEERLPGEGYERLYGINSKKMFELGIGSSYIGKSKEDIQKHLLNQDTMDSFGIEVTESGTKMHEKIEKAWLESGLAINTEGKIEDKQNNILGYYDALVHDPTSKTGKAIVDIKTVGNKKFNRILQQGHPEFEHQSQTNYYLWATGNKKSNGYIYYVNRDNPEQTFTMGFQFDENLLQQNLNTLNQARNEIYTGLENGTIGRGELYSNLDRYRILADVAPYSDEFQSIKARLANDPSLTKEEQAEISQINERVKQQKEPLRVYPYKFKTSNLQNEKVKVKKVLDNNTLLVDRYGVEHAVKFAGIHVNESNTDKYDKNTTMNEAAAKELKKYIKRGKTITIGYDYDEANKFKKDSTESIRAVVYSNGKNVNQIMLNKGLATEKDKDDSPAAIHARYTKNEIAFGSAMERITHKIGSIPFIGNKLFQVKSPYEQYRDREVYGKDFQSWNHFIRDYLGPEMIDKVMSHGNNGIEGIVTSTVLGTFLGSLFGASKFGKMIGGFAGGTIGLVGGTYANTQKTKDKDWIPKRREKQAELNEYFDTLKYVKNMSLYEKYKEKALKENHIDVTKLEGTKELQGIYNKNKTNELKDFKKVVKLDYKHRKQFDFKYGAPETLDMDADAKSIIKSINQELTKIQSDRSVERVPENVVKAISYKQQADQTMYGYNVGDPLNNLMKALPKKERQYFKYFMKAPEEEKYKILRIAPEYLKRGLQQAWGMEVDEKPSLQEYFQTHGLPDASWIGWDESTNIEDVKVKLVHNNKLDMGEFDLWNDQINQANQSYIPVPKIRSQNSNRMVQLRLQSILGKAGYEDAVVIPYFNAKGNKNTLNVYQDSRDDISNAINNLDI